MTRNRDDEAVRAQRAYIAANPPMVTGISGVWLVAVTAAANPYPCLCDDRKHWRKEVPLYCDCIGRTDFDKLAHYCCAIRVRDGAVRQRVNAS